jgi:hypothetical protein
MKTLLTVLMFISIAAPAQRPSSGGDLPFFKDVRSSYQDFDQISPVLVNGRGDSIFLSRLWPYGNARVERFNDDTGKWESGEWPGGCGVVDKPNEPIEIKPHDQFAIAILWRWSMDDWDKPKYFVLPDHETKRPLNGKYKLVLRYALTPWTVLRHPKETFTTESTEFTVGR